MSSAIVTQLQRWKSFGFALRPGNGGLLLAQAGLSRDDPLHQIQIHKQHRKSVRAHLLWKITTALLSETAVSCVPSFEIVNLLFPLTFATPSIMM